MDRFARPSFDPSDAEILIVSLNSRVDELTAELELCRSQHGGEPSVGEPSVGENSVKTPIHDTMYDNVIETLQTQLLKANAVAAESAGTILKLKEQVLLLSRDCDATRGFADSLHTSLHNTREEVSQWKYLKYCPSCGENTPRFKYLDNHWCVECAVITHANAKNDTPTANVLSEFDAKIAGYQKVIIALTDKLAEAYGVEK